MMDSIKRPFDECKDLVRRNITIDPHFASFVHWASEQGIPVVILTSGMEPLVSALLSDRLGPATTRSLQIIANNVQARDGKGINEEGGWEVVFHDERCASDAPSDAVVNFLTHGLKK